MDEDLSGMTVDELADEVIRLRSGVRLHRDEKGHDRCWLDDQRLYELLPENTPADMQLPDRAEFLENCSRYYELRRKSST